MILLCGEVSDSPLSSVHSLVESIGIPYILMSGADAAEASIMFELNHGRPTGILGCRGRSYALEAIGGVYLRMGNDIVWENGQSAAFYDTFFEWCQIADSNVVTRPTSAASNSSKPYQAQLIQAQGLSVPDTIVSNDADQILAFRTLHRRIVYKSMSATRSIVRLVDNEDLRRLDRVSWCPTQFQQYVEGLNVRVHVVGDKSFATAIHTDAVDYRYPSSSDRLSLTEVRLPHELEMKCLQLASALNLPFAGIDLKVTPAGRAYCFEVNPSPAFTYYERQTGQPIAHTLIEYLTGDRHNAPLGPTLNAAVD